MTYQLLGKLQQATFDSLQGSLVALKLLNKYEKARHPNLHTQHSSCFGSSRSLRHCTSPPTRLDSLIKLLTFQIHFSPRPKEKHGLNPVFLQCDSSRVGCNPTCAGSVPNLVNGKQQHPRCWWPLCSTTQHSSCSQNYHSCAERQRQDCSRLSAWDDHTGRTLMFS